MTDQTEPIRRSELPCIPPPEWEFHTWFPHPDGGGDMVPGQRQRGVLVRRRVSCGDWEPVRPDRWADEPETDARAAVSSAGPAPATDRTAVLLEAADIAEDVALRLRGECLLDQVNGAYEVMSELRRMAGEAQQAPTQDGEATALDLADGPVLCPLCPYRLTLHTPAGARAHFATVHPEQRLTGRGPGPWPLLTPTADGQPDTEDPAEALARHINAQRISVVQRAFRLLGWSLRLVEDPTAVARPGQPETEA